MQWAFSCLRERQRERDAMYMHARDEECFMCAQCQVLTVKPPLQCWMISGRMVTASEQVCILTG